MSAMTLAQYEGTDGSHWNGPDEVAHCQSRLYRADGRVLFCTLDAEHRHDQTDSRHGNGLTRWTTQEAAAAAKAPRCIDCGRLPHTDRDGYCTEGCASRERWNPADDMVESEAA